MKDRVEEGYSHVLKYTGLFGGVQVLVLFFSLVRNKFMALFLGASGVGFNSLMVSVQNFASQSTNLGISFGAVPRLSEYFEQGDTHKINYYIQVIRLWSIIAAALGFVFCVAVSPFFDVLSFDWGNHTLHYALISVAVALAAITGGETAILKATRRLGALAKIQLLTAAASVVISVPLYYFFWHGGVVPAIVLVAVVNMVIAIGYSYRCYPLQLHFERGQLREGAGMLKLGIAFVLAAAVGSGAEMLIRSFLNINGELEMVGLYNVGYMVTITYAGMVFSSMETDYYPRLSAVQKDIRATNETVNKQMEVSLLMLSPMLVGLLMFLPLLIPLLFSDEFLPVVSMTQVAVLAMYFKVLTLPVAYITLARSYPLSYLFLETMYYVAFVLMVVFGFSHWGIFGTGLAIVAAHVFEYLFVNAYAYWKYGYRCTWEVVRYALVQLSLGIEAYFVSCISDGWVYWTTEAALTFVSTAYSLYVLRQKTHLWEALMRRLKKR